MSVRVDVAIKDHGWHWDVFNVTPGLPETVPNIYRVERHQGVVSVAECSNYFDMRTLEHIPATGLGELLVKVFTYLPPVDRRNRSRAEPEVQV